METEETSPPPAGEETLPPEIQIERKPQTTRRNNHENGRFHNKNTFFSDAYPDTRTVYSESVEFVLKGMGMEKYVDVFKNEDISLDVLLELTAEDFNELGITDEQDVQNFVRNLKAFHVGSPNHNKGFHFTMLDRDDDDLVMANNVLNHMLELSTFCCVVNYRLGKCTLPDFFVTDHDTALRILTLVINHCIIQLNRISAMIYNENSNKGTMISTVEKTYSIPLPSVLKEKLREITQPKNKKAQKKSRKVYYFIAAAVSLAACAVKMRRQYLPMIRF